MSSYGSARRFDLKHASMLSIVPRFYLTLGSYFIANAEPTNLVFVAAGKTQGQGEADVAEIARFAWSLGVLSIALELPAQEYFKGKTITIVAGFPNGGGVDAEARLLARFLARHIPGHPSLIVRNIPGAGGMVAANWFESLAKPDGFTLEYISSSSITQQVFGTEGLKYDLRSWELLGSIVRSTSVALVRPGKLERLTDLSKPNLAVGSRTGDDSWNTMFLWGAEYLNMLVNL